ncbi:hypothetical protein OHA72_22545 [Dactylosporangium sp. NBC_01737]|uniref:hypothetical protein n=1 Tax=Dactylosporangium sp. NBC_01737 TaxID=2975959 RepID=UPI002E13A742|nr:hypothetical protein OHA72_22545 [Dactylosporangium sp. NBC_01737]
MNLFHRTPPPTTTPDTPPSQHHNPTPEPRRLARRALQVITYGLLTGAATTAGKAAMDTMIWLIHHH